MTKQSLAARIRPSAGIRLPTASITTSPGTTASAGISTGVPSRSTRALSDTCWRNFCTAREALYSCAKPSKPLPATMARIIKASSHPPIARETLAANSKISTSGLANCLTRADNAPEPVAPRRQLGPNSRSRHCASASVRPPAALSRATTIAVAGWLQ
jgi:hypothetical protein